jgi:hypothetical protein
MFHTVLLFCFFSSLLIWWFTDLGVSSPKKSRTDERDLEDFLFLVALDLDRPRDVDLLRFAISSWIMLRTDFFLPGMVKGTCGFRVDM